MKNLVDILKSETQTLKEQYIQKTKMWAEQYFKKVEARKTWKEVDWCKFLGITPRLVNEGTSIEFLGFPNGFYNTSNSKTFRRLREETRKLTSMGIEKYLEKEQKYAELHYETSIQKLAARIEKKGLNVENLKVVTSHVGVNIDTVLSDGEKTVKAFTIIAEGEIQRPHYRYLIK